MLINSAPIAPIALVKHRGKVIGRLKQASDTTQEPSVPQYFVT